PSSAMQALSDWDRPGNVRELENVIERSVILSRGPRLAVPLSELEERPEGLEDNLEAAEREHILKVLRECGEGLSGEKGAKKSKSGLRSLLSSAGGLPAAVRESPQVGDRGHGVLPVSPHQLQPSELASPPPPPAR